MRMENRKCQFLNDRPLMREPGTYATTDDREARLKTERAKWETKAAKWAKAGKGTPPKTRTLLKLEEWAADFAKAKKQKARTGSGATGRGMARKAATIDAHEKDGEVRTWGYRRTLYEALRDEDHRETWGHVFRDHGDVNPAVILYRDESRNGWSADQYADEVDEAQSQAKERDGKRLKKNARVALSRVISYPVPLSVLCASKAERQAFGEFMASEKDDPTAPKEWRKARKWTRDALSFCWSDLKGADGKSRIRLISGHTDEGRWHFHVFAVAELLPGHVFDGEEVIGDRLVMTAADFHGPERAISEAVERIRRGNDESRQTNVEMAYRVALQDLQTRFHVSVSSKYGHERNGNDPHRREGKTEYRRIKRISEMAEKSERKAEAMKARAQQAEAQSAGSAQALERAVSQRDALARAIGIDPRRVDRDPEEIDPLIAAWTRAQGFEAWRTRAKKAEAEAEAAKAQAEKALSDLARVEGRFREMAGWMFERAAGLLGKSGIKELIGLTPDAPQRRVVESGLFDRVRAFLDREENPNGGRDRRNGRLGNGEARSH